MSTTGPASPDCVSDSAESPPEPRLCPSLSVASYIDTASLNATPMRFGIMRCLKRLLPTPLDTCFDLFGNGFGRAETERAGPRVPHGRSWDGSRESRPAIAVTHPWMSLL